MQAGFLLVASLLTLARVIGVCYHAWLAFHLKDVAHFLISLNFTEIDLF